MKKLEFSVSAQDQNGTVNKFKAEFSSVGDGKYQPVVTIKNNETGYSSVTHLPVGDYAQLRNKLDKLFKLDSKGVENAARKVMTLLSWAN